MLISKRKSAKEPSGAPPGAPSEDLDLSGESQAAAPPAALRRWLLRLGVVLGLAVGLGYLPLQLFGERGLIQYRRLQREHGELKARNDKLAQEIRHMELEVRRLRDDDVSLERAARDDLGMVRPGELIFVVDE